MANTGNKRGHWSFNPFSYKGRIGRLNYLIGIVLVFIISFVYETALAFYGFIFFVALSQSSFASVTPPLVFTLLVPTVLGLALAFVPFWLYSSLHVKRLHDLDFPGKFIFLWHLVEYGREARSRFGYGWWFALIYARGTVGPNQYGEDPTPNTKPNESSVRLSEGKKEAALHLNKRKGAHLIVIFIILLFFGACFSGALLAARIYQMTGTDQVDEVGYRVQTTDGAGLKHVEASVGNTLGCYSVTYDNKQLFLDSNQTSGSVNFDPINGFFAIDTSPVYLGDAATLATQIASRLGPSATTQEFITTSGIKGTEVTWQNGQEILIPGPIDKNGETVVLVTGTVASSSDNGQPFAMNQNVARSVTASSICLRNVFERIKDAL